MYKIYKFDCDESIMTLPISWIKHSQVYVGPNARAFIKAKKDPLMHWPLYRVSPVDTRVYATYGAALKAEEILLLRTDIDTSDCEKCSRVVKTEKLRTSKKYILPQSDDENSNSVAIPAVPVIGGDTCQCDLDVATGIGSNQTESVQKSDGNFDYTCIIENQLNEISPVIYTEEIDSSQMPQNKINAVKTYSAIPIQDTTILNVSYDEICSAETISFANNEQEISTEIQEGEKDATGMFVDTQSIKNMTKTEFEIFKQDMKSFFQEEFKHLKQSKMSLTLGVREFEKSYSLPLKILAELEAFELNFSEVSTSFQEDFKSYMTKIGGRTIKEAIKIINRVYHVDLQKLISYTGREKKKFAIKDSQQIKFIIGVLAEVYDTTESDAVLCLHRYLYQTCDRVRSVEKLPSPDNSGKET